MRVYVTPDYRKDNPYQDSLMKPLTEYGVDFSFTKGYKRFFPIFRGVNSTFKNADIVHIHWMDPFYKGKNFFTKFFYGIKVVFDLLLVRASGRRLVWTLHNYGLHDDQFAKLTNSLMRIWAKIFHLILIMNRCDQELVCRLYSIPESKIGVVPHGTYDGCYGTLISSNEAREKLKISSIGNIFLFLGMIKPYKGLDDLLKAWQKHVESNSADSLIIAGKIMDVSYEQELTQLISATKNVLFHNKFIKDDEIHLYYSAADVVVLPFKKITNSGSLLLALTYDCPVIAPNFPVVEEILGAKSKTMYDKSDSEGLHKALGAFNSKSYDSENESKEFHDKYNWQVISKSLLNYYKSL